MAVSSSALIPRVRTYLDERPFVSTGTAATAGTTTVAVTDGTDWAEGAIVEFQDNGEQCLVQSVSGNNLTVIRGWNGTTAASHSSITVFRDPQWTYQNIEQSIGSAVRRLWPYAYKATADTVTPVAGTVWYDLAAGALALIEVNQRYGSSDQFLGTFGDGQESRQVVLKMNMPTGLVTSTVGVRFPDGFYHSSNTVNVIYATEITGTSDIEDAGDLAVSDAVIFGALARLLAGKEAERVGIGEDLEQSRSIRVGGRLSAGAYYERMFRKELEALRLNHKRLIPIMPTRKYK